MSKIDDVTLIAYVDGELDPGTIEEVETEMARDRALYEKVRQLRESTALISAAFNHALYGPLPKIELGALPVAAEPPPSAEVITLKPQAARNHSQRRYERINMALAASLVALVVGGITGHYLTDSLAPAPAPLASNGDDSKRLGAFVQSLESEVSGTPVAWKNPQSGNEGTLTPTRTFQAQNGQYCREYEEVRIIGGRQQTEGGIACREQDSGEWRVRMRFYPE
jgi:surface antigen